MEENMDLYKFQDCFKEECKKNNIVFDEDKAEKLYNYAVSLHKNNPTD